MNSASCNESLPNLTLWLMIEVLIFYSYIFLECITAILILIAMVRRHDKRIDEEIKAANLKQSENQPKGSPAKL